jgi:hypothetical protein
MATECFCLVIDQEQDEIAQKPASLGEYLVEWRRKGSSANNKTVTEDSDDEENEQIAAELDVFNVKTKIALPELKLETFPFLIETKIPTFGTLDKELRLTYFIKNKLQSQALDIECILDENEYFSISGKKMASYFY